VFDYLLLHHDIPTFDVLYLLQSKPLDHFFLLSSFLPFVTCFIGDEGVAMFEGGTWSSGLWPLLQLA
jgi:hypothetical protein